jgi:NAD+ kinase
LGINIGRLGFLTELEINEIELLKNLFIGEFKTERRMLLDVSVLRNDKVIFKDIALNDVVISYGHISRMINLSLLCDERKVQDYKADGLIVCTPTGSTAYSLSAGGPIIEPLFSAITVTPICAHSLSSKSIVFTDNSHLKINVPEQRAERIYLTTDGLKICEILQGDCIKIEKSKKYIQLVKLTNRSFYEILYKKFSESGTSR